MMKKIGVGILLSGWLLTTHAIAQDAGWANQVDNKPENSQQELGDETVPVALDAGWVNYFDGTADNYQIKRGDKTVPVALFTVLQVGDEISVNHMQHPIELSLRGGTQPVVVTHKNSPFVVERDSQVPAERDKLWTWIKPRFSDWQKLTQSVRSAEDSEAVDKQPKKTPKLIMPLLENVKGPARLVAGKRPLHLQWYGGESPYGVVVYQRRNRLLNESNLLVQALDTKKIITFKARKSYRVMLFGAKGQFMGGFRVVDPKRMPSYPEVLQDANLPDDLRLTLQVTWLVMQEKGRWIFEAYQQVAPLTNYRPAQLLKEALARGVDRKILRDRGIRG